MQAQNLTALLLLAGDGGRLGSITHGTNKCLLPIQGKAILWYSLNNLLQLGVKKYIIVLGHKGDMVRSYIQNTFPMIHVTFVENKRHRETNNIYSFYVARHHARNTSLIKVEGDLLYNIGILQRLIRTKHGIVSAVQQKKKEYPNEYCIQVNKKTHTIVDYGEHIPASDSYGEVQGIDIISKQNSNIVCDALELMIKRKKTNEYVEYAYRHLVQNGVPIHYSDNKKTDFWFDVDTPEDLAFAQKNIHKIL